MTIRWLPLNVQGATLVVVLASALAGSANETADPFDALDQQLEAQFQDTDAPQHRANRSVHAPGADGTAGGCPGFLQHPRGHAGPGSSSGDGPPAARSDPAARC